ncbi:hypothetical protein BDN72DRAFT_961314 [Pluteus cervinus]|uniref:Uncharacterized protein n=1 Tax=Pluteus cervinus TaxID=181527 RepID=A0ACD3AN49_9AGAR|nr:hypothetical protein BDN72DRAFT_961314 [Pluteus cervinus]
MSTIQSQAPHPKKKIILALDGTWQDGTTQKDRQLATNIWKLARAIHRRDENGIHQVVYYQSGVGSTDESWGQWVSNQMESIVGGATGLGLAKKVKEAYMFLSRNWEPGDEIYIFGFSRGAYTARTVAGLIGDIGVLRKEDMESWWQIYENYQQSGTTKGKKEADEFLEPWRKKREEWERTNVGKFTIKVLGVFDTVGALGIPGFYPKQINFFGFNDLTLGKHVENAFHAMSLNENRHDFQVSKWKFGPGSEPVDGQTVKQVWFAGTHADIGGGWEESDLSIISLMWMADSVKDMLSLDEHFLLHDSRFSAHKPWGTYPPHDFFTGMRAALSVLSSDSNCRANSVTLGGSSIPGRAVELLHPSVFQQNFDDAPHMWPKKMQKDIGDALRVPAQVAELGKMEKKLKEEGFALERIIHRKKKKDVPVYSDDIQAMEMMNRIMSGEDDSE